jgi:hypothetical protein
MAVRSNTLRKRMVQRNAKPINATRRDIVGLSILDTSEGGGIQRGGIAESRYEGSAQGSDPTLLHRP